MCPQSLKQLQPTLLVCPRHFCLQFFSSVECSLRSYLSATNTIGKTSHNHFFNFFITAQCDSVTMVTGHIPFQRRHLFIKKTSNPKSSDQPLPRCHSCLGAFAQTLGSPLLPFWQQSDHGRYHQLGHTALFHQHRPRSDAKVLQRARCWGGGSCSSTNH